MSEMQEVETFDPQWDVADKTEASSGHCLGGVK